jgi:hypothetical protein
MQGFVFNTLRPRIKYHVHQYCRYLLLAAMLWCICGHVIWTSVRRVHYMAAAEKEANVELRIAVADIEKDLIWVEENEVKYRGKMFDIKAVLFHEGVLKLRGHFDEADDNLFHLLARLFNEKQHNSKASNLLLWLCEATIPAPFYTEIEIDKTHLHIKALFDDCYAALFEPAVPSQPPIAMFI